MNESTLVRDIQRLVMAQLVIEESPEQFAFRHALTHDAVYRTLLMRERKRVHHLVAETIERLFAGTLDAHVGELAHHYYEAETWEKALAYSHHAGERAQQLYAPREAVGYFTRALESARHLAAGTALDAHVPQVSVAALHRARGQAYETLGNFERSQADYDTALQLARLVQDHHSEWQALLDLGFLWAARDYHQTGGYFERALEVARVLADPATLAHTLNRVGNWHGQIGQLHQGLAYHQQALNIFESLMDRRGIAETLDLLGLLKFQTGDWFQAATYYERVIALFRELGDRRGLSSALANYAQRAAYWADITTAPPAAIAQAITEAAEALQLAQEIGWRSGEAHALLIRAMLQEVGGEYQHAFTSIQQSIAIAQEIEHRQWLAFAYWIYSWLYRDVFALDEALQHAERGLSLAQEVGSRLFVQMTSIAIASVRLLQNDWPGVERAIANAWHREPEGNRAETGEPVLSVFERWLLATQGELSLAQGDPARALQIAEQLLQMARQTSPQSHVAPPPAQLAILQAEALAQLAPAPTTVELEVARIALQAVCQDARARGARSTLWHIHLALGKLHGAQKQHEAAAAEFAAARALIAELATNVPTEALRSQFLERALLQVPTR